MAFKNIYIKSSVGLNIKNEQLVIEKEGDKHTIPLEDISSICIESLQSNITTYTLYKFVEHDIVLYVCDKKHLPTGVLIGTNNYSRQLKNINRQLGLSKPIQKRIWQDIIKRKIENQANVLKMLNISECEILYNLIECVQSGDTTNVEARAAAIYFKALFGKGFNRNQENIYNGALNYGYSIVRGLICRTLIVYGFEPAIGIFHHNQLNNFNLADDIIETFRPLVDIFAIEKLKSFHEEELTTEIKKELYNITNSLVIIDGKRYNLTTAVDNVVKSLSTSMENNKNEMKLPVIEELKVYTYA